MAIFHDGTTDSLQSSMLSSIKWQIRYGVMMGESFDSPAWKQVLGSENHGTYQWVSPEMAGSITYTVQWGREEGVVRFRLIDAVQPF